MSQIHPYLNFDGNCMQAMNFYKDSFGGELVLQTIKGSKVEKQCSAAIQHYILHATLTNDAIILIGSDMKGNEDLVQGNSIVLSLNCSSKQEIENYFTKLSIGGEVFHALKHEPSGATFGVLTDKYGIRWLLNYDSNKSVIN